MFIDKKSANKNLIVLLLCFLFCAFFVLTIIFISEKANATIVEVDETKKAQIYTLAPEKESLMQSYVIKTPNGKLIVIDGGIDGEGFDAPAYLSAALRAIAGVGEGEYFEVEAWFVSHVHVDHYGELSKMLNTYNENSNYKIKNFYFDFPEIAQLKTKYKASDFSETNWELLKLGFSNYAHYNDIANIDGYYDRLNGAVVNAEAIANGLTISVDGVAFEILQTWNAVDSIVNSNSMIIRANYGGQSALFLNDCYSDSGNRLLNTYSAEFLKSDIVQMAHHGQSGTDRNVYDVVDAEVRLWSIPDWVWQGESRYQTGEVRTWVGLPYSSAEYTPSEKDIVACMYSAYPTDSTKVADWASVIDEMKISFPYSYAYSSDFEMVEKIEVELDTAEYILKATAYLNSYDSDAEYGFLVVPKNYIVDNAITGNYYNELLNYCEAQDIEKVSAIPVEHNRFVLDIDYSVSYEDINTEFAVIAYGYKNGEYTYASFSELDNVSASFGNAAVGLYNDYLYDSTIDTDYKENLRQNEDNLSAFVKASVNCKNGISKSENATTEPTYTLSFNETALNLNFGESVAIDLDTVFDERYVVWTSSNNNVAMVSNKKLTTYAVGQAMITAKCAGHSASLNVNVGMQSGYLADFSSEGYEIIAKKSTIAGRAASTIKAEYLTEYAGVLNVLKVTSTNNGNSGNTGIGDIIIELPKACTTGMTVKYMFAQSVATFKAFSYIDNNNAIREFKYWIGESEGINETWQTLYLDYNGKNEKDKIQMEISGGARGAENIVYFAYVKDGDQTKDEQKAGLAAALDENYYADFSSAQYSQLFGTLYGTGYMLNEPVCEYLSEYDGESGVMKIEMKNVYQGCCGFVLDLPKNITSEKIEIRLYNGNGQGISIVNPDTNEKTPADYIAEVGDSRWFTLMVDYSDFIDKSKLKMFIWVGSATARPITTMYLSYVKAKE